MQVYRKDRTMRLFRRLLLSTSDRLAYEREVRDLQRTVQSLARENANMKRRLNAVLEAADPYIGDMDKGLSQCGD